jgi:hypothetical protein
VARESWVRRWCLRVSFCRSPSLLRRRLGTWHALALGTPWHLARDRRDRASVDYACSSRPLVVCARCACSPCLCFCSCVTRLSLGGRPGTWLDLALGTLAEQFLHRCFAGTHALQAHLHCRHTCIAAHNGQMHVVLWTCTQTCKSGDGMETVLYADARKGSWSGGLPPAPCLFIVFTKSFQRCQIVYQSINISLLPRLTARSQEDG